MPHWLIALLAIGVIGGLFVASIWKTAKDEKAQRILELEEQEQARAEAQERKKAYLKRMAAEREAAEATEGKTAGEENTETAEADPEIPANSPSKEIQ